MKGPFGRMRFDVSRLWRCPVCGRFDRSSGVVVNLLCRSCRSAAEPVEVWMRLIEAPEGVSEPPHESEPPS